MHGTSEIYDVLKPYGDHPKNSPAYVDLMLHEIPPAHVVDREKFILQRCDKKRVLNLGSAKGKLHGKICKVAKEAVGVDKVQPCDQVIDLDRFYSLEPFIRPKPQVIVCGEILEHLSNPGHLLDALKLFNCPVVITVPNALANGSRFHARQGYENVNEDHVAWYSWRTLKTLVERSGFRVVEFAWYGGEPVFAEGIIFVVE